ncbi:MAG: helix-turn-helix domain-containing protein [Bacteroidota bacterium]
MQTSLQNSKTLHLYREKGLALLYKKGYYNTSLEDICSHLGLSEEAFIHSFVSKEDFFIGITQNLILQRVLNLLIEPVTYQQSPFPLILDKIQLDLDNAMAKETDNGFVLANFMVEFNNKNHRINKYLIDILKIWEINLVSLLRKGQLDGFVKREVDCEGVAKHIISSYIGVRTLIVEGNPRLLADQHLQQLRYYFYSISTSFGA